METYTGRVRESILPLHLLHIAEGFRRMALFRIDLRFDAGVMFFLGFDFLSTVTLRDLSLFILVAWRRMNHV
jgi:hypothetical protein